jgi:hypothetical protein
MTNNGNNNNDKNCKSVCPVEELGFAILISRIISIQLEDLQQSPVQLYVFQTSIRAEKFYIPNFIYYYIR